MADALRFFSGFCLANFLRRKAGVRRHHKPLQTCGREGAVLMAQAPIADDVFQISVDKTLEIC